MAPQVQEFTAVNESGLYDLIFQSNKPEAKRFRRWVTHDVLPALMSRGSYDMDKDDAPVSARELRQFMDGTVTGNVSNTLTH